jgi:hypothetical protein
MNHQTPHGTTPANAKNVLKAEATLWLSAETATARQRPTYPQSSRGALATVRLPISISDAVNADRGRFTRAYHQPLRTEVEQIGGDKQTGPTCRCSPANLRVIASPTTFRLASRFCEIGAGG